MKILYLDAFLHAINPSNTLMPNLINGVGDVTYFGPGYVSDQLLAAGVLKFAEKAGPYDVVVVGTNIPLIGASDDDVRAAARYAKKFTALSSSGELIYRFYKDVRAHLRSISASHRFASMIAFDYYSATQDQIDRLEQYEVKLITHNSSFVRRIEELPEWTNKEKHYQRQPHIFSNAWYDYVNSHPEKIVTALHFVSDSEFSFRGLSERKRDISIPGVDYVTRREATSSVKKLGLNINGKSIYNAFRVLNRLGIDVYANYGFLKFFNASYFYDLMSTKYVYTAAEAFGVPIRKYFEIPASGAVLLASSCNGFDRIGFKDGINCVVAGPQQLAAKISDLKRDPEVAQRIATAGRNLMFEQHSLSARTSQIKACMEAVLAGHYQGADWIDGKFVMRGAGALSVNSGAG